MDPADVQAYVTLAAGMTLLAGLVIFINYLFERRR
jgi:hypothetical protein